MAKIFTYAFRELLPFILNLCGVSSSCFLFDAVKEKAVIFCLLHAVPSYPPPSFLWCFLWSSQRELSFISLTLDWSGHFPSMTVMTDQQIRKQPWIIDPTTLSSLKWRQKYNSMIYFGLLEHVSHGVDVCGSALSQASQSYTHSEKQNSVQNSPAFPDKKK